MSHSTRMIHYSIFKGALKVAYHFKKHILIFFKSLWKALSSVLSMLAHSVSFYLEKAPVISDDLEFIVTACTF